MFRCIAPKDGPQFAQHRDAAIALETEDDEEDDPAEADGDDRDGNGSEEDFMRHNENLRGQPGCPISDPDAGVDDAGVHGGGDRAYAEWHTLSGNERRTGAIDGEPLDAWRTSVDEDEEDDDPREVARTEPIDQRGTCSTADEDLEEEEDRCPAGDDMVESGPVFRMAVDRRLDQRDPGRHARWEPGSEDDAEREQMLGDVPTLPVHSLDHDLSTDKRTYLGRSNLLTSFRSNGKSEVSADTGKAHRLRGDAPFKPGVPV